MTVRDGQIFWRGVFKSREEATRLRDEFASQVGWVASQTFARALTAALNKTAKEHA